VVKCPHCDEAKGFAHWWCVHHHGWIECKGCGGCTIETDQLLQVLRAAKGGVRHIDACRACGEVVS